MKVLACRGPNGIVECPAELEVSRLGSIKFEVYGIRKDEVLSHRIPVEESRYELFPRKLDNSTYVNNTVIVDGEPVELFLYFGEKSVSSGVRVVDKKCYIRLVDVVYTPSTEAHVVKLENEQEVSLFGEILIAEKPAHKRWLGFGFPWLGMGALGWGWGLGWGLPLWGLLWG